MPLDQSSRMEWRRGWRTVLGAATCAGFGLPLFFYVFSLFADSLIAEFGATRGQMSNVQALLVLGALVSPLVGRWFDRFGFRRVFAVATLTVIAAHIAMGSIVGTLTGMAAATFVYGSIGIACGPLGYTRPINAWFWHSRGLALGTAALGLAITTAVTAPLFAWLIEGWGWRAGFWALAAMAGLIALPITLWLVRDAPPEPVEPESGAADLDRRFMRMRDFWLLAISSLLVAAPGAGLISQNAPMMREEGLTLQMAALGVSFYAIGQVAGRIIAGYFLDVGNPRLVAFAFTFLPAIGFAMLTGPALPHWAAIGAVALVGIQQGAEIDLFAWFTARRFGLAHYGRIYGWMIAAAWLGNAIGILGFGWSHDFTGSFRVAEIAAGIAMMCGAVLIALVSVTPVRDA